jgi:phytoene desaturase
VGVVGAGLAGLSAALHLRGAGLDVTVVDPLMSPGGRAAGVELSGPSGTWSLDTGPTVITLPDVAAAAFRAVGDRLEDRLDLVRLDPAYRARFDDGSHLDLTTDRGVMAERVRELAGPDEAAAYTRYTEHLTALFHAEQRSFIDRNMGSPFRLLGPDLLRVAALRGFGRLAPLVSRYFTDDRLRRVFSFQSLYAGLSPERALGVYAVISYMDLVAGVVYPRGGVRALPRALAAAARDAGVEVLLGTRARHVERVADRVTAVVTDDTRIPVDAVVLTTELPEARVLLGSPDRPADPARHSPSCVVLATGSSGWEAPAQHHTLSFGQAWSGVFADLDDGRPMRDPSYLLSAPTVTDPSLAPAGAHGASVLFPAPNLESGPPASWWDRNRAAYRRHVLDVVERTHPGLAAAIEVEELITPADWARRGMAAGTPFAAAHTLGQTGPWRTPNVVAPGVVLAGSNTVPGVGVPMVLVSGRLAAERLTGASSETRSHDRTPS